MDCRLLLNLLSCAAVVVAAAAIAVTPTLFSILNISAIHKLFT